MERYSLDAEQAFRLLTRISQHSNQKIRTAPTSWSPADRSQDCDVTGEIFRCRIVATHSD